MTGFKASTALALVWCLSACTGSGSDLGPKIPKPASDSYKALVRDDQDRGVAAATVSVAGFSPTRATRRSGRVELPLSPSGRVRVKIEASNASAVATDELVGYTVAVDAPGNAEVPYVLHLPDMSNSTGLVITAGIQGGASVITGGASETLTIAGGSNVDLGAATSASVDLGKLSAVHVPGDLPGSVVRSSGAGVLIRPTGMTVSPGATLSLPNDLGLVAAATADLLFLDPDTGEWSVVGTGTADGGATNIVAATGVGRGGLYCFSIQHTTTTTLTGRVLDRAGVVRSGVLVRVANAWTVTGSDGRYTVPAIGTLDASGAARSVSIEFHGGRELEPNGPLTSVPAFNLTPGSQDLGDQAIEVNPVFDFRSMTIYRGRGYIGGPISVGSVDHHTEGFGVTDTDGVKVFWDQAIGHFTFLGTVLDPRDDYSVLHVEGSSYADGVNRTLDLQVFATPMPWAPEGSGGSLVYALGKAGHGQVRNVELTRTNRNGLDEWLSTTPQVGIQRFNYDREGWGHASHESSSDGVTKFSTYSIEGINGGRVEFPIERAVRKSLGAFEQFGLQSGSIPASGKHNKVRSTRILRFGDWYDDVYNGVDQLGDVPFKTDPGATPGNTEFLVGVPAPRGNLAVTEGLTSAGDYSIDKIWLFPSLEVSAGSRTTLAFGAGLTADTAFTMPDALVQMDSRIAVADLSFDLGIKLSNGVFVDVARNVGGNQAGSLDRVFTLPALSGQLEGASHFVSLSGAASSGGATVTQRTYVEFSEQTSVSTGFLEVPVVTSPAPGATVSATGFDVDFSLPDRTTYAKIQLRHESSGLVRDWSVLTRPHQTRFSFRSLPSPAQVPLATGAWTLKVTAVRTDTGRLVRLPFIYERCSLRRVGLPEGEIEITAQSSWSINLTLN